MDKKRIDIDDLVRQRLSGPEAPMPTGAWNKMSALLDEHMPEPVSAFRGRRFLGLFLLLGALAGSAGYAFWQQNAHAGKGNSAFLATSGSTTTGTLEPGGTRTATGTTTATQKALAATTSATASNSNGMYKNTVSERSSQSSAKPIRGARASAQAPVGTALVALNRLTNKNAESAMLVAPSLGAGTGSPVVLHQSENAATGSPTAESNKPSGGAPFSVGAPMPIRSVASPRVWALAPAASRLVAAGKKGSGIPDFNAHSLNRLLIGSKTIAELNRLDGYRFSAEGLSARKAAKALRVFNKARARNLPQTAVVAALPAASKAATATVATTQSALLVPLSNFKVASRKSAPAASEATAGEKLSAIMENVKQTAAQTKFYAGTLAGISSTLAGAGSLQGFHFGLMGMMAFSERFALVAELRYLRQFNGSSNLRDDYYTTHRVSESAFQQSGASYNVYRYDLDSNVSIYKFEGLNTFQVPLYARVNFNRFSLLGGINLAYHMRTDVEQGGARIATISRYDTVLTTATPPEPLSRTATISIADFGSRFGIGYVAGAAYSLSPSLSLDMRVTQQVWDSRRASSEGARTISKTYFQLPTLQLSVGYRFQQRAVQPRRR